MLPKQWPRNPRLWLGFSLGIGITLLVATFWYQLVGHPEVNPIVNLLVVMSGVILTALVTLSTVDYLNSKNQQRQWRRDATLEAFVPVYHEIRDNIVNLGKLRPVSTEKWRSLEEDPRSVALVTPLWDDLDSFYRDLVEYEQHEYPSSMDYGRSIANRTVFFAFKMRGYGASYQDFAGMGDAIQRDLPKMLDGDLLNLVSPDAMAAFHNSYNATVSEITKVESEPSYRMPPGSPIPYVGAPFPSAGEALKNIKRTVASETKVQALLASQYSLRAKALKVSEQLRAELQKFYGPPPP